MTTAAVLAFGTATSGAHAQEPETPSSTVEPTQTTEPSQPSTPPSEPSTPPSPPSTPVETPPSEPSTPPSTSPSTPPAEPGTPPSTAPASPDAKQEDARPALAGADEQRADLAVRVVPDHAEFPAGEDIGLTVSVKNKGEAPATNIRFGYEASQSWLVSGAADLSSRPSLAPGAEKSFRVVLRPTSPTTESVPFLFRATIDGVADPTPGDNGSSQYLKVRQFMGSVSGVVYADANGNGAFDQGEGLPNTNFRVEGGSPFNTKWGFTDATGAFKMWNVVAGRYTVTGVDNDRRAAKPGSTEFVVEANKDTYFPLPVAAPVRDSLTATMSFGKPSYHVSEKPGLTITLKNSGNQPIERVVAVCSGYGPEYLNSDNFSNLRPDGPGVTVPAGGETTVSVTTDMPKLTNPWIYANCFFGNNGRNTAGSVWVGNVRADVTGLHGAYSGKVVNAETGEPVRNAVVNVLDPVTRRPVKDVISADSNGELRIYSLDPGKVLLQVAGRWKPQDGTEFLVDVVADQTTSRDLAVVPSDVTVPDVSHRPDLAVTAVFDKDSFDLAEPMRAKVTVSNNGTGRAAEVWLRVGPLTPDVKNVMEFDRSQFGDLGDQAKKVSLWPGESREITIVGTAPYLSGTDNAVRLPVELSTPIDTNPRNNAALATTAVTFLSGDAAVVLYGDANENGRKDADEKALADAQVYISGGTRPGKWADGRTDASGRVAFKDFPLGVYSVSASYPDGWVRPGPDSVTVSAGVESVLELGARRPLSDKFFATLNFTKDEYRADEDYEAVITLENRTGADMPVVNAFCSGPGGSGEIYNTGSGWGRLAWDGGGVPVPNGEKRTFRVSGPLPEAAASIGYATLGCVFAPDTSDPGAAGAGDSLRVPGLRADAVGKLVTDGPNGEVPKAGMTVVVVETDTKKVAARTITDAGGNFGVSQLPVGRYDVVVPGPWKVEIRRMGPYFYVRTGGEQEVQLFHLVPGPEVEDPGYPLPEEQTPGGVTPGTPDGPDGTDGPAGAGGVAETLAKTGASVLGLGLLGALLVAFGFGASMIGRRRRIA
ncbi:hypothetical protein [Lentzea sp. HUAS12]|uniref:hypothetical protein n=1 Tax=Lentzea sp. HUAS12 TaxID=2951806 RepID=UPI0020A03C4E|nr:hypothetical protein [Lentzea sp. HUAS12]USX49897.1 hypothetical protein ND450_31455 [Lentzea sp. HUAS12]